MTIETYHASKAAAKPLVLRVRDCIKGQHHMQMQGHIYLPYVGGMVARWDNGGKEQYEAYKKRARFTNLVQDTENGIIGLAFKDEPISETPFDTFEGNIRVQAKITNNGRTAELLARSQLREILETGGGVMVVDAPSGSGGDPYVAEYPSECLIDWAVDDNDNSRLIAIKLREEYFQDVDTYKINKKIRFRQYLIEDGRVNVYLQNDKGEDLQDVFTIPLSYIPVFTPGSVDNLPDLDPIPLLPVADSAIAMYQISADYRQWLHVQGQGTVVITGADGAACEQAFSQGMGTGACWGIDGDNVKVNILESSAGQIENYMKAMDHERLIAEQYMIAVTSQGSGIEAAESLKLRAATKHATVHSVINSLSTGIQDVLNCMSEWAGKSGKSVFKISADFTENEINSQLITALNAAVNSQNLPKSVIQNAVRKAKLIDLTNEQMDGEILDNSSGAA